MKSGSKIDANVLKCPITQLFYYQKYYSGRKSGIRIHFYPHWNIKPGNNDIITISNK